MENNVLGVHAGAKFAVHLDATNLERTERHRLGGEHVAHLAGADAERDRAKRTVGGSVGIAASDRGAGLRDALLGPDDVDDALLARGAVKEGDAELGAVFADLVHHGLRERILVGLDQLIGRDDVVHRGEGAVRHEDLETKVAEHAESLRGCDLVDEVRADDELGLAIGQGTDRMGGPDFFEERFG